MSLLPAVAAGGALGVRHALETDHLAAIATIDRGDGGRAGRVGAWWALGHGVPIAIAGVTVLLVGVEVPGEVTGTFEVVAGALLVLLGATTLLDRLEPSVLRHDHDGPPHRHVALGGLRLGTGHQHVDATALVVGVVHGLAGSGVLVVALVATASSWTAGVAFLCGFVGATTLTMAGVSAAWYRAGSTRFERPLRLGAGVLAVGVGLGMVLPSLPWP